jgi:hypothetical protein
MHLLKNFKEGGGINVHYSYSSPPSILSPKSEGNAWRVLQYEPAKYKSKA